MSAPRQMCTRCVMDSSDPDLRFDGYGVCDHCRRAEKVLPRVKWSPEASARALEEAAARVRRAGRGRDYDAAIGLSGGVDSSYAAHLAHRLGIRTLAVHFDNGWNSEIAVQNIQKVVEGCGFDLVTYVIDWQEFRDLQRAFLLASVIDIELVTDNAIMAAMINLTREHKIGYLLSGYNVATEHGLPSSWIWHKFDWTNIKSIHDAYGTVPLRSYPHISTMSWRLRQLIGLGPKSIELLNLVNYRRDEAAKTLESEYGWQSYGDKHQESLFTKYYQGAILPRKFGIDKRRVHLSDRIRNGELTREEALDILSRPVYPPDELRLESEYVRKKLGFSDEEWEAILAAPPRSHADFATDRSDRAAIAAYRVIRALRRPFVRDKFGPL